MHRLWLRALLLWLLIALAETVHGILRGIFIAPQVGDLPARQLGVFVGAAIILGIAVLSSRWLNAGTRQAQWQVGMIWVSLMLAFEISLGRMLGFGWQRLLADYDPRQGGLMLLGMLVLLLAPMIAARLRPSQVGGKSAGTNETR